MKYGKLSSHKQWTTYFLKKKKKSNFKKIEYNAPRGSTAKSVGKEWTNQLSSAEKIIF